MAYGSRGRVLGGKGGVTVKVEAERPNLHSRQRAESELEVDLGLKKKLPQ